MHHYYTIYTSLLWQGGVITSILDLYKLRARDLHSIKATDTATATAEAVVVSIAATDTEDQGFGESGSSLRQRKGWGDRSVNHLLAAIDRARHLPDHRYVYCSIYTVCMYVCMYMYEY